jgi:hypothetical protein
VFPQRNRIRWKRINDDDDDDDDDGSDFYGKEDQDDEELNTTPYTAFVLAKRHLDTYIPIWAYTATQVGVRNLERNFSFMKHIDGLISFQSSEHVFLKYILDNGSIKRTWYVVSVWSLK